MPSKYDRPERRESQTQHEQLCECCGRELGRQAVRRSDMSQIDIPLRNNAFTYFPGTHTPEQIAKQWEDSKAIMDSAIDDFPDKTWSETADELERGDEDAIQTIIRSLSKSA